MFLQEPVRTPYDITFNLFGFEVRTSIFFFILPLIFGNGFVSAFPNVNPGIGLLVIAGVFWVSILVHELGHAFAFRYFGIPSRIVMYWMGGMAIPEGTGTWMPRQRGALTPKQQIVVSLAGPVAGLLLAAVLCILVVTLQGKIIWPWILPIPAFGDQSPVPMFGLGHLVFLSGIVINVILNLFNLLPVYPMDGGQVARQAMVLGDPWNGIRKSLILSMVAAIGMVLFVIFRSPDNYILALFFGFMAFSNFQELQGSRW